MRFGPDIGEHIINGFYNLVFVNFIMQKCLLFVIQTKSAVDTVKKVWIHHKLAELKNQVSSN